MDVNNDKTLGPVAMCATCPFWQVKERDKSGAAIGGQCVRFPPTPIVIYGTDVLGKTAINLQAHYPPTVPSAWCGEHPALIFDDDEDGDAN